jgi:hypothetical protein
MAIGYTGRGCSSDFLGFVVDFERLGSIKYFDGWQWHVLRMPEAMI